jgi:hypothetical protein
MKTRFRFAFSIPALMLVSMATATQPPAETGTDASVGPRRASDYDWVEVIRFYEDNRADQQVRLRDAVSRAFDARQAVQRAEVERLRRELAEIETAIQERERQRERIIQRRVRELMRTDTSLQPRSSRDLLGYQPSNDSDDEQQPERRPLFARPRTAESPREWQERLQRQREARKSPVGRAVKELEGTWRFVAAESLEEGWDQPVEVVRSWVWWIRGSSFDEGFWPSLGPVLEEVEPSQLIGQTFVHGPGPVPGFSDATLTIYPTQSPKAINLLYHNGISLKGIYKIDEKGHLIICVRSHAEADGGRPTEFMFDGDSGLSLLILRKVGGDRGPTP